MKKPNLRAAVLILAMMHGCIEFKERPSDDPLQRRPDIALARKVLDWQPATRIEDGLVKTIAYFKRITQR